MNSSDEQELTQIPIEQETMPLSEEDFLRVVEQNLPLLKQEHKYGYVFDGGVYGCTKEDLKKNLFLIGASRINYVWIPESETLLKPEQTDFLLEVYKENSIKSAKNSIWFSLIFLVLPVGLAILFNDWTLIFRSLIFIIGFALLANGIWSFYQASKLTREKLAENIAEERKAIGYFQKVSPTRTVYQTYIILVCIGAVYLAQSSVGLNESLIAAGQINALVSQGEIWRLFTATVMHGGFLHIFINGMALWNIGRAIEGQLNNAYISIVFFLSALCGSVLSQAFYFRPDVPSIGASGGIIGMIGFLASAAYIYKEIFPREYFKAIIQNVVLIIFIGIVGFAVIDNAAHLGGLLCGAGLGFLLLKKKGAYPEEPSGAINLLSIACLAAIILTALGTIWILLRMV